MPSRQEDGFAEAQVLSQKDGQRLLRRLARSRGCKELESATRDLVIEPGSTGNLELVRGFIYPTEYEGARFADALPSGEVRLLGPITPSKFEQRKLGLRASFAFGESTDEVVPLDLKLDRWMLFGFATYPVPEPKLKKGQFLGKEARKSLAEQKVMMPVFGMSRLDTEIAVRPGDYVVVRGLNAMPPPKTDFSSKGLRSDRGPSGAAPLVAVIKVGE